MIFISKNKVIVTNTSNTNRNTNFKDTVSGKTMTRNQFVKEIEKGNYENYHIRKINGVKTPVSNPNNSSNDNLG